MATMNGVPFRQMLVPSSKYVIKCPYIMNPKKITIHNTDNQMPAENEITFMRNNGNQVSYHVAIDEKEAIQGVPFNRNGWHAGDGLNGYGNRNTVGVEMCRNYDRTRKTTNLNDPLSIQFDKTFDNTIRVVAQMCVNLGIVANSSNVKQHKNWSGKHCPSKILNDNTWNKLLNGIIAEYNRLKSTSAPKKKEDVKVAQALKPTDNKVYRLKTGYFTSARALADAKDRLQAMYPNWNVYEKADTLEWNPNYRLLTGTLVGSNVADYHAERVRNAQGWNVYVIEA